MPTCRLDSRMRSASLAAPCHCGGAAIAAGLAAGLNAAPSPGLLMDLVNAIPAARRQRKVLSPGLHVSTWLWQDDANRMQGSPAEVGPTNR